MAGVKAGCVHLCRVAGNTVWSHMASDTPYLCHGILPLTAIQYLYPLPFYPLVLFMTVSFVAISFARLLESHTDNGSHFSICTPPELRIPQAPRLLACVRRINGIYLHWMIYATIGDSRGVTILQIRSAIDKSKDASGPFTAMQLAGGLL